MNILIVDDNEALCRAITKNLEYNGCLVDNAHDGKKGLRMALEKEYDVILLDIMMPQMDGHKVLKNLRAEGRETPIIMVSAKDGVDDNIESLDLGADDYVQKPFNMSILLAKIRAVARRAGKEQADSDTLQYSDFVLRLSNRKLEKNELQITLSSQECNIMKYLIRNSSVIVSEENLKRAEQNDKNEKIGEIIENLVKKLKYICSSVKIITIKGVGYKLCA